eukprot:CAMPEP_0197619408 /NCGR_PEP_ID=MMETSP1338-20131121/429_1 /TAXON_ID=43686 ORGANISM="Pelagodinium beii, Strain RCC1491" /NCGR_SAMPLE_ID=MMETSP1338 /ASSEMBLY_ACC=CAM_ASM_000754 /LENGTH=99 /DNA_ID=CAMNT_0043188359 /DNA_START=79 /DNA_END=376 /DNA_ORIENTATION=-
MAVYPHLLHAVAVMLMLLGASGSVYDKVASKSDYSEGVLNHTQLNSSELQKAMSNVSVEILSVETLADPNPVVMGGAFGSIAAMVVQKVGDASQAMLGS